MVPIAVLLAGLVLASPSWAQKPRPSNSPIDKISAQEQFDPARFAGKWFLVGVASDCLYLRENSYRLEATHVVVSMIDRGTGPKSLLFSTFRPLEGICWNIKQTYFASKTLGRFLLKGRGAPMAVVVGETDYSSYAILYLQKHRKISAKLYGRTAQVANDVLKKFEAAVAAIGMSEDLVFYYPVYGFCHLADQFHILDEKGMLAKELLCAAVLKGRTSRVAAPNCQRCPPCPQLSCPAFGAVLGLSSFC